MKERKEGSAGGGKQKTNVLTVNSQVASNKSLKAGLRVQRTPFYHTARLPCGGALQLSYEEGTLAMLPLSQVVITHLYSACKWSNFHFSSMAEIMRL